MRNLLFDTNNPEQLRQQLQSLLRDCQELEGRLRLLESGARVVREIGTSPVIAQNGDDIRVDPCGRIGHVVIPNAVTALPNAKVKIRQIGLGSVVVEPTAGRIDRRPTLALSSLGEGVTIESDATEWWSGPIVNEPAMGELLAERYLMNCALGYATATSDTEVYAGSGNSQQGMAFVRVPTTNKQSIFLTQRPSGSAWAVNETMKIVEIPYSERSGDVAPEQWSDDLLIGHGQDLSGWVDEKDQVWLFCTQTAESGHTGADAGRGYSKIRWNGSATDQGDVTNYQLIGYTGSGHALERFYNGTACVSSDGKLVLLFCNDTKSSSKYCLMWDRAIVESAADPLDVPPIRVWKVTTTFQSLESNILQGVACDGERVYALQGYYNPFGWIYLNIHDMDGNVLRSLRLTGPRSLYTDAELLDHPTFGSPTQIEPEGLSLRDNKVLVSYAVTFRENGDDVTYDGENYTAIVTDTGDEPPHQTRYWARTSRTGTAPWSDAAPYSRGTRTFSGKFIFSVGDALGEAGEFSLNAGRYSYDSGATIELGNGYPDITVPFGQNLQIQRKNYQTNDLRKWLEYDENTMRLYDAADGADQDQYCSMSSYFQGGREYLGIRANQSVANGAGTNWYGADDSDAPHGIRHFCSDSGNHSHELDANSMLLFDEEGPNNIRTSWVLWDYVSRTVSGNRRCYTEFRADRNASNGAGFNAYGSADYLYPDRFRLYGILWRDRDIFTLGTSLTMSGGAIDISGHWHRITSVSGTNALSTMTVNGGVPPDGWYVILELIAAGYIAPTTGGTANCSFLTLYSLSQYFAKAYIYDGTAAAWVQVST